MVLAKRARKHHLIQYTDKHLPTLHNPWIHVRRFSHFRAHNVPYLNLVLSIALHCQDQSQLDCKVGCTQALAGLQRESQSKNVDTSILRTLSL